MTLYEAAQFVPLLSTSIIIPLARWVWKIRTNELKHVQESLERIEDRLENLEDRLDEHVQFHLNKSNGR